MDEPDGRIKAVMLRFYGSFLPYEEGPFDVEGFAELVRKSGKAEILSGSSQVLRQFSQVLECKSDKQIRAAAAAPGDFQIAKLHDVEAICPLTDRIEEFSGSSADSRQTLHKALESKTGRTYFAEKECQIVVAASTAAENSMSAMIIAVATHPEYRGQGLATQVVAC